MRGGTLVYGVEADTANPWPGYRASFAPAGYVVISTVTDPLFLPNDDGETMPHLVETAEPNADFTQWKFTLRDGITFHDGTPFDAAAVKVNIDACRAAPLSRSGLLADHRRAGRRPGRDDHDRRAVGVAAGVLRDEPRLQLHAVGRVAEDAAGPAPARPGEPRLRRGDRGDAGQR